MKVLAIDPGFGRCGMAIVEKDRTEQVLFSTCVETSAALPHAERLRTIAEACAGLLARFAPDALAIEALRFAQNKTTGLQVAEARGVILAEAARANVPVFEYAPSEVKVAVTGSGRADKTQIARMVAALLRLDDSARLDDEIDAIAVGLTHLARARSPHTIPVR